MPPERFYRVEWLAALGWPDPMPQHPTARNFTTPEAAARQLARIKAFPDHCTFTGLWIGNATWAPLDPVLLPDVSPEADAVNPEEG